MIAWFPFFRRGNSSGHNKVFCYTFKANKKFILNGFNRIYHPATRICGKRGHSRPRTTTPDTFELSLSCTLTAL